MMDLYSPKIEVFDGWLRGLVTRSIKTFEFSPWLQALAVGEQVAKVLDQAKRPSSI
jgi:hypothetical protein